MDFKHDGQAAVIHIKLLEYTAQVKRTLCMMGKQQWFILHIKLIESAAQVERTLCVMGKQQWYKFTAVLHINLILSIRVSRRGETGLVHCGFLGCESKLGFVFYSEILSSSTC